MDISLIEHEAEVVKESGWARYFVILRPRSLGTSRDSVTSMGVVFPSSAEIVVGENRCPPAELGHRTVTSIGYFLERASRADVEILLALGTTNFIANPVYASLWEELVYNRTLFSDNATRNISKWLHARAKSAVTQALLPPSLLSSEERERGYCLESLLQGAYLTSVMKSLATGTDFYSALITAPTDRVFLAVTSSAPPDKKAAGVLCDLFTRQMAESSDRIAQLTQDQSRLYGDFTSLALERFIQQFSKKAGETFIKEMNKKYG